MQQWLTLRKTPVLSYGKWLTVETREIQLPSGRVIHDWAWVITPDYANVAAFTPDGSLVCFRQVKYAVDGTSLAPVGGYIEPGEDPLLAAQRELMEETGYTASQWLLMGSFPVDANRGCGTGYFYLALDARPASVREADDLEEQEMLLLPRSEVEKALMAGKFKVMPWAASIAMALLYTQSLR